MMCSIGWLTGLLKIGRVSELVDLRLLDTTLAKRYIYFIKRTKLIVR
jgi:hypothetical protein